MGSTHRIIQVKGHYEIYDNAGKFVSSGDTWDECYNDLLEMLKTEAIHNIRAENIREVVAVWVKIGLDIDHHTDIRAN